MLKPRQRKTLLIILLPNLICDEDDTEDRILFLQIMSSDIAIC